MKQIDIDFLEGNRFHHEMLMKAGQVRHLDGNTRSGMQRCIAVYWIKGYTADLWCGECCMDMLKLCYRLFDKYLADNIKPEIKELIKPKKTK